MTHTPTPWAHIKIERRYHEADGTIVTVATVYAGEKAIARCHSVDDAEFIVKSCNNADYLHTALNNIKLMVGKIDPDPETGGQIAENNCIIRDLEKAIDDAMERVK